MPKQLSKGGSRIIIKFGCNTPKLSILPLTSGGRPINSAGHLVLKWTPQELVLPSSQNWIEHNFLLAEFGCADKGIFILVPNWEHTASRYSQGY